MGGGGTQHLPAWLAESNTGSLDDLVSHFARLGVPLICAYESRKTDIGKAQIPKRVRGLPVFELFTEGLTESLVSILAFDHVGKQKNVEFTGTGWADGI